MRPLRRETFGRPLAVLATALLVLSAIVGASAVDGRPASAAIRTLYVDPTGSDATGSGSSANPWQTIGKAVSEVVAGDLVIINAGTYAEQVTIEETHGSSAAPIVFRANGEVVIDGAASTRDAVFVTYSSYITLEGWTVREAPRAGLRIDASDHITVRGGTFADNGRWGIFTDFSDDLLIEDNEAYGSELEHGIYHSNSGDRPTIRGNVIHDNYAAGLHMNADASMGGDGIISGALVEGNVIYNNGAGGGAAINMDGITDSIVRNNLLYNNRASGIAIFQIDGAVCSQNNQFLHNTIQMPSNGRWAITIPSAECVNNTFFNNIFLNDHSYRGAISTGEWPIAGFQSDYNVVKDRFTTSDGDSVLTLAQWQALGNDSHSIVATSAQLFVASGSDFHLKSGSPAIDAGRTLANATVDLDGNSRPRGAAPDAGAYESGAAASTATPTRTATRTATATATATATRTATRTPTATPTRTPTSTATATSTSAPSNTATARPTNTATITATTVPTHTVTRTATAAPSATATSTPPPSATATRTPTATPTATVTRTPTATRTSTRTATATRTPTKTETPTRTPTPKPAATKTKTPAPTATPAARPRCTLSPTTGRVTTKLTLTCTGFLPGEPVGVYWDTVQSEPLAEGVAGAKGAIVLEARVPATTGGRHSAIAYGETSRKRAAKSITVQPRIALGVDSGAAGEPVTVALTGFQAGEAITLRWYTTSSKYIVVASNVVVDAAGSASTVFIAPGSAASGPHKVEARGGSGSRAGTTYQITSVNAAATEPEVAAPPVSDVAPTSTPRPPRTMPTPTP